MCSHHPWELFAARQNPVPRTLVKQVITTLSSVVQHSLSKHLRLPEKSSRSFSDKLPDLSVNFQAHLYLPPILARYSLEPLKALHALAYIQTQLQLNYEWLLQSSIARASSLLRYEDFQEYSLVSKSTRATT